MRKLFFLSLIVLGTLASQAQTTNVVNTNTVPSSPTTPTAPVAPAAPAPTKNSEDSISHKIKLIDEKIALIYEKEKKTPLTEADFLRLDRLQEARMIAELRLQTGFGDTNRLNELLADELVAGHQIKDSLLSEKLDGLAEEDRDRIYDVIDTLLRHAKKM